MRGNAWLVLFLGTLVICGSGSSNAGAHAVKTIAVPALPPALLAGLTGPVPAPISTHRHQLRLL
jgi:hypothetical protein